ncbi:MAG: NAD(P)/FAD-dependent oxidoreductase [Bryobacterales bacterium]|nr:NAD(P)/FAD-dependent oxidoreductase [Bryobacteraceae bacterium]MDW8130273.1 NAD(P)/FAD-dependent oxidoreductase [Bryobacterales bacterium]
MRRVAVIGGGPAGAFAAERLAQAGLPTILFDEKLAWEKPCGGGLTYKAYQRYPFLLENGAPKKLVTETRLAAPGAGWARLTLKSPLLIYSRYDLNRMLLERAVRAGAQLEQERVLEAWPSGGGWLVRTRRGVIEADFLILATGARNNLRNLGTEYSPTDMMLALGYYLPDRQEHIDVQFVPFLEGYIWVFPRCGHLSAGICGKRQPAAALRAKLESYLQRRGLDYRHGEFYAHLLPSLEPGAWLRNRVSGPGWLAVGDAGGLVDPVTGEGLYYAIRSADLAAQVVLSDAHSPEEKPRAYRNFLLKDFVCDLAFGAGLAKRLFLGRFLFGTVPQRMVQFMRRSPRFYALMQDLFAGTQSYRDLKERLLKNLHGTFFEMAMNFFFSRVLPRENPV